MHRVPMIIAALLLLLCTCVSAQAAKEGEWQKLNDEVKTLYQAGKIDQAVVVAKKALQVAEKEGGANNPNLSSSLNNLALLYTANKKWDPEVQNAGVYPSMKTFAIGANITF